MGFEVDRHSAATDFPCHDLGIFTSSETLLESSLEGYFLFDCRLLGVGVVFWLLRLISEMPLEELISSEMTSYFPFLLLRELLSNEVNHTIDTFVLYSACNF